MSEQDDSGVSLLLTTDEALALGYLAGIGGCILSGHDYPKPSSEEERERSLVIGKIGLLRLQEAAKVNLP